MLLLQLQFLSSLQTDRTAKTRAHATNVSYRTPQKSLRLSDGKRSGHRMTQEMDMHEHHGQKKCLGVSYVFCSQLSQSWCILSGKRIAYFPFVYLFVRWGGDHLPEQMCPLSNDQSSNQAWDGGILFPLLSWDICRKFGRKIALEWRNKQLFACLVGNLWTVP